MKDTRNMPPDPESSPESGLPPHQKPDGRPESLDSDEAQTKVILEPPDSKQGILPHAPMDLRVNDVTANSLKLTWQMKNKNSVNVQYYVIKYKPREAHNFQEVSGAFTNSSDITDLLPTTEYEFAVLAVNNVGRGELSKSVIITTRREAQWEPDDSELTLEELKEAFRLFDEEKMGYITIDIFKGILEEIEPEWTEDDLNEILADIDTDHSGTIDFDEFVKIMIG